MDLLPDPIQRAWLIKELAALLRLQGHRQFLSMPIVEPTPEFFPDPWSFSIVGLDRVVRRLMQFASIGDLDVHLSTFSDAGFPVDSEAPGRSQVAAVFQGLDQGCAYFAFNQVAPADSEYMAGVMGHEVAHAYRAHHDLMRKVGRDREEWRTDLTAVFLGFGILVANNSDRYRTSGLQRVVETRQDRVGYLTPQAYAFLLAMQVEARGLDEDEVRRLSRHLEANQAACLRAALEWIRERPEHTVDLLGLPDEWDPPVKLDTLLLPLPPLEEFVVVVREEEGFNHGSPVFRVPQGKGQKYSGVGILVGSFLGSILGYAVNAWWTILPFTLIGFGIGLERGLRVRFDTCSDPECESPMPSGATVCPGCGGTIAGTIRRAADRLDAEEALERKVQTTKRKRTKRPKPEDTGVYP